MKTFTLDFDLDLWVTGVEIEADSYEEAIEKLRGMSADEIIEEGYVKNKEIKDVDYTVEDDEEDEEEFEEDDEDDYTRWDDLDFDDDNDIDDLDEE